MPVPYDVLNSDHIGIVAMPELAKIGTQISFYRKLLERLAELPAEHHR